MKCKWGFLFCQPLYVTVVGHVSMGLNTRLWFSCEVVFFKYLKPVGAKGERALPPIAKEKSQHLCVDLCKY